MKRLHGLSRTPLYSIWNAMRQRCLNPSHRMYKWYGKRGITVCEEWVNSFEVFLADMGPRPTGMTLERKQNDLGYSKENCEWASRKDQANNRAPIGTYLTTKERRKWKSDLIKRLRIQGRRPSPFKKPPKICIQCGGEFTRQGSTKHAPKYCSKACHGVAITQPPRACEFCGITFKAKYRVGAARFCSLKCSAKHRERKRRAV